MFVLKLLILNFKTKVYELWFLTLKNESTFLQVVMRVKVKYSKVYVDLYSALF